MTMEGSSRDDIRKVLKSFGIQADEALVAHLARLPDGDPLKIRLVLEDRTDYGGDPPEVSLGFEMEGVIRRG
jgi:hypothetical protein